MSAGTLPRVFCPFGSRCSVIFNFISCFSAPQARGSPTKHSKNGGVQLKNKPNFLRWKLFLYMYANKLCLIKKEKKNFWAECKLEPCYFGFLLLIWLLLTAVLRADVKFWLVELLVADGNSQLLLLQRLWRPHSANNNIINTLSGRWYSMADTEREMWGDLKSKRGKRETRLVRVDGGLESFHFVPTPRSVPPLQSFIPSICLSSTCCFSGEKVWARVCNSQV